MKWWWASCTEQYIKLSSALSRQWESEKKIEIWLNYYRAHGECNVHVVCYIGTDQIPNSFRLFSHLYILYITDDVGVYSKFTATNLNNAHMSPKTVTVLANTHTVLIHINLYIKRPRQGQYFQWVTLLRTFVRA